MKRVAVLIALAAGFAGLAIWLAREPVAVADWREGEDGVEPRTSDPSAHAISTLPDPYQWALMQPSATAHAEPGNATLINRELYGLPWR